MSEEVGLLKNFRRRFIFIMVLLVGVVALIAFVTVGISNYQAMRGEIATALNRATRPVSEVRSGSSLQDGGNSSDTGSSKGKSRNDDDDDDGFTAHSIPLCTLVVSYSDFSSYSAVYDFIGLDDDTLKGAVNEALSRAAAGDVNVRTDGGSLRELSDYGLYYKVNATESGLKMAFVPKSVLWQDVGRKALVLAGVWALLMVAVWVITLFLSRYVTRPIERAWKDQQRFIADASHELKTPLTVIMADVSILKDNADKTVREQSAWVEGISNEAVRMKQLTEDLLTLAQADAGVDMKQVMGDVDLSSVVEGQVLQFDAVAFERGLSIEDSVSGSLHVMGDQVRLENMVKTLLENACKYSARGGSIDVRLAADRGQAVLSVHNEGDPIPAEDLPHLFDRFYRSDKARTQEGEAASFGLGLSIAKSTAEMHGGKIGVTSNSAGTTFTVKIPLVKAGKLMAS